MTTIISWNATPHIEPMTIKQPDGSEIIIPPSLVFDALEIIASGTHEDVIDVINHFVAGYELHIEDWVRYG